MTTAYVVPPTVYSLMVMGTYLDLIDQDLAPTGTPLKILYAQRCGFFPSTIVVDNRDVVSRVDSDLNGSLIPLERFLNGLIKQRLVVQATTMVRNIERRYTRWYRERRAQPKKMTDTMMNNRDVCYLPSPNMVKSIELLVKHTMDGTYLNVSRGDPSPYKERMTEIAAMFDSLVCTDGEMARSPFKSSQFFPLLSSLMSILHHALDDPEESYRFRMHPIVKIIFIMCRLFNGDVNDKNYDAILLTTSCDTNLHVSDSTLAIMSGSTSEVIRSLGIAEPTPISRLGQVYLTACDSFVDERDTLTDTDV